MPSGPKAHPPPEGRRRALLSVYDKRGVVELATGLAGLGWELVASGGTARALREAGLRVTGVASYTGSPPILGHRVVTLHPKIHGGILADRHDPGHRAELDRHAIRPIDLVAVNLYPFGSEPGIEMIDIGGPALVRAAAKNHAHVTVITDPTDYRPILEELRSRGEVSPATRRNLARTAFAHTAAYDAGIVDWMDASATGEASLLPPTLHLTLERAAGLRYGENPHQPAARYRQAGTASDTDSAAWWDRTEQHGGLPLSYLNLYDAGVAWALVDALGDRPAVAIIKHGAPCGAAVARTLSEAYRRALACDRRAAFGGIVALNRPMDPETVAGFEQAPQADVVIAPGFDPEAIDRITARRTATRILGAPPPGVPARTVRQIEGGWLVQAPAGFPTDPRSWQVVTRRRPTVDEVDDATFAWKVCGFVPSNAVVLARERTAWGIGGGRQDRVGAVDLAAAGAGGRAAGGACASDGFFPFPDGLEAAVEAGVAVVVQPGGSSNDGRVIEAADRAGISMMFTGERQFRH